MRSLSALVWLIAAAGLAQQRPLAVDTFLAPPQPRLSAKWAPGGKRFAYQQSGAIWLYDIPTAARRELIKIEALEGRAIAVASRDGYEWQNRRVEEQSFQWSASGQELLIAAGGDLFLLHVANGKADQLTATPDRERDPKLSPNGALVSFRRGHDLYCLDIAAKKVTRLTHDGSATLLNGELDWVYPEELQISTAHWWSPDSSRIAFFQFDVSQEPLFPQVHQLQPDARYEPEMFPRPGTPNAQVRLGVASTAGALRWMDLGDPRDRLMARVYWSPDARSIAVERLNRVQNELDLLLADANTGVARVVLHEQDPYWINVKDDFRFVDGGQRFLWGSERDGYRHLYLYGIDGKRITQITRGDWEVTQLAGVDEANRQIFFVSTEANPLERQLYRTGFDGRHKQRLTTAAGTHTISMSPACDYYLDTFSTANQPPGTSVHDRSGEREGVYAQAAPAPGWLLRTELIDFTASDGEKLYARLIRPEGFVTGRKYPVIVSIYGGPHAQEVTDAWRQSYLDQFLAHRGYVIWQVDNRGSAGRGHKWESRVYHDLGAQELKDQLDGLRHLQSLGFADLSRAGINGWSYGGFMTLYALTHSPDTFRAGAAGAPVTDWRNYDSIYTERYMGLPADNAGGYRQSSPITSAGMLKAKLLLLHNVEDDNVHFANTLQMVVALEEAGKHFDLAIYPQRAHGVTGPLRRHLWEKLAAFFDAALQ